VFYDTETTGLKPAFDQITQFAAIVTDQDFNIIEEVNLRCRLQPHVLASPGAMFVTKVGPKAIQSAPLSCYEMVRAIRAFIQKWSPAVFIGFNSISYDENMLRQAFYQHLHPVYPTNTNGNSRMDILRLAHAVAAYRPDTITVPLNDKGKPTFKLGLLAAANGLALDNAHDAHADTRATLGIAKLLRARAPEVWESLYLVPVKGRRRSVLKQTRRCFLH
jgi:exodeoxyribonuclease-1